MNIDYRLKKAEPKDSEIKMKQAGKVNEGSEKVKLKENKLKTKMPLSGER